MSPSTSKRRRTQVSYNLDPYKDLDSDAGEGDDTAMAIDANSSDDEEFTVGSPGKGRRGSGSDEHEEGDDDGDGDGSEEDYEDEDDDDEDDEDDEGDSEDDEERVRGGNRARRRPVARRGNADKDDKAEFSGKDQDTPLSRRKKKKSIKEPNGSKTTTNEADDDDDDDDDDNDDDSDEDTPRHPQKSRGAISIRITRRPGLPAKSNSKRERIESIYGNGYHSLVSGIRARDSWITDPVLPKRRSLEYTPFYNDEAEVKVDLGEGGQRVRWVDYETEKEFVEGHLPKEDGVVRCILGPLDGQKVITFRRFGICDLKTVQRGRNGYMLNAGGHVMGMDWAPNRPKGHQYLALSVKTPTQTTSEHTSSETPPAYARTPGPSHIQIWRIPSSPTGGTIGGKPSLALIITHPWGTARSLKWCPIPNPPGLAQTDKRHLGYLGGVFADGTCKVVRVALPPEAEEGEGEAEGEGAEDAEGETYFAEYVEPLFNGYLQDTLCTCLAWLSTHEVAVGCSNGFAAVWDIRHAISSTSPTTSTTPKTTPSTPPPTIPPHHYLPLHQTYILDIQSCTPSYPSTITTSSMDGHCRLTSLLDPHSDSILTGRSRLSSNAVVWVDCIHTVLASEEGTWVKMYPLRRFWSSTSVARQSQGGVILGLAGSLCHPFVLAGGGEGEVVVFNPLRRTFHGKIKVYQQTWFQIEYSPKSDMYRLTEGFKMENISFKFETRGSKGDGHSTVFEERGGVTRVCWNQNTMVGGWAAAGTAGGLVRVEDLAV